MWVRAPLTQNSAKQELEHWHVAGTGELDGRAEQRLHVTFDQGGRYLGAAFLSRICARRCLWETVGRGSQGFRVSLGRWIGAWPMIH